MRTAGRVALRAAIAAMALAIWFGLPSFAAAGLALDHPAWSDPDDPAIGSIERSTSVFPPGVRYEWIGGLSGERRVEVDPWGGSLADPIVWTALCVGAVGAAFWLLGRSRPRLPGDWREGSGTAAPATADR